MRVDAIQNGIVIDHITAGRGMQLYELLGLQEMECPVALMLNARRSSGCVISHCTIVLFPLPLGAENTNNLPFIILH